MRVLTAVTGTLALALALEIPAQEIFVDGFESGSACEWSEVTDGDDSQASALNLGQTDDCDGNQTSILGEIHETTDVDFTVRHMTDEFACSVDPSIAITTTDTLRFCIYFSCDLGTTSLTCPGATVDATADSGALGCCTTTDMQTVIQILPTCTGTSDDDGTVWTEVSTSGGATGACAPYTLVVHN